MRENGISKDDRSNLIPDPCAVFSKHVSLFPWGYGCNPHFTKPGDKGTGFGFDSPSFVGL